MEVTFLQNARIEYIEGYSGHADQEWLMNFVYSFITKPKHIFLVHGEEESQNVLQEKIINEAGINTVIPSFGETYELNDEIPVVNKIERKAPVVTIKDEVLQRLEKVKNELKDMDNFVKEDMNNPDLKDSDMFRINEKIKDLEKQILNVIEG